MPAFGPGGAAVLRALALALLLGARGAGALPDLGASARSILGAGQGVQVELTDGTVLVSQAAAQAVHPASVSKVPTTLALLRQLGASHRFTTRVAARGALAGGVLDGDLVVEGGGDPFLVDENALLILLGLRELGIQRVRGDLVARGRLLFDWTEERAAARLRAALEGKTAPAAWSAVRGARAGRTPPGLVFAPVAGRAASGAETPLLTHRSEALVPLLKAMNGYSNNVFAWLAETAIGIDAVQTAARAAVPAPLRGEIVLGDGAGENPRNRISPRAAVALLRALEAEAGRQGATLADLLPVAGVDEGTLRHRLDQPGERGIVVGKTGTYGSYGASALAGAFRSKRHGMVYFAILDHGVPVDEARRRQDAFVRVLLGALEAQPFGYARDDAPAFTRARVEPDAAAAGGAASAR